MMDNKFYKRFTKIIRQCNYDNTYKMAWAKSLVEICSTSTLEGETLVITLKDIAYKFFKYYWNQTIFFDLVQGSNPLKQPLIVSLVKEMIEKYFISISKRQPEVFEKVEDKFEYLNLQKEYIKTINKITQVLKKDVSWRFDKIEDDSPSLYDYSFGNDELVILTENAKILKDNEQDLYDLVNYRWSLILETFNSSPRINKKVRIVDERIVKRNSLASFKKYLDLENPEHRCFICGKIVDENELSIDHVIPWSYMYSDDLWNLVYVCKHCNSIKSNVIPSKHEIDRLKERNNKLLYQCESNSIRNKNTEELKLAIDKDYVNKFWTGCKG